MSAFFSSPQKNPPNSQAPLSPFSLDEEEVRSQLSDSDINKAKSEVWLRNEYELIATKTRNVLFVGKTRSGKSTAIGVLKDPCYSPSEFSIFSETVDAKFQSFSIKDNTKNDIVNQELVKKYTFNMIDSPGLFEVKATDADTEARSNEVILHTIQKCLENEITKLNCVVLFASFSAGVDANDVAAIKIFARLFNTCGKDKLRMALCVTRADNHDAKWRESIKNQVYQHPELAPIIKENNMEILFMGCIECSNGQYYNIDHLYNGYRTVYSARKKFLDFLMGAEDTFNLGDLDLIQQKKNTLIEAIAVLIEGFRLFKTVQDWGTQQINQRILIHEDNARIVDENKNTGYKNVSDIGQKFSELFHYAREFYNTASIPLEKRTQLVWPLDVGRLTNAPA